MKILAISAELPFPPIGGGRLRIYHWLNALSSRHDVTLIAFTFDDESKTLPPFPLSVIPVSWEPPPLYRQMEANDTNAASEAFKRLRDELSEPWYASYFESAAASQAVREQVAKGIDLVLIEDSDMGRFLSLIPRDVPKILDLQNVYTLMARRKREGISPEEVRIARREAERTFAFESSVAAQCDLCLTCSDHEAAAARDLLRIDRVEVLPNGVDTNFFTPQPITPSPGALLFTGSMNYAPNVEAVMYFVTKILPLIHRRRADVVLQVVGKDPPKAVQDLRSETVLVHGQVPDVRPYFAQAEVVVAPILSGGGTRLKILEAAAMAKPIITTTLGVEGLELEPNSNVLIADSPSAFADAVFRLLGDTDLQKKLGSNARCVSLKYDWNKLEPRLCELVEDVAISKSSVSHR